MRQWMLTRLAAALFAVGLPAMATAQHHVLPIPPDDPFTAATPYNPTRVGRPVPTPELNRPNFRLSCELPNQNRDPFVYPPHWLDQHCGWFRPGQFLGLNWGGAAGCGGSWLGGLNGLFGGSACGRGCGANPGCGGIPCGSACNSGSGCSSFGSLFDRFRGLFADSSCCAPAVSCNSPCKDAIGPAPSATISSPKPPADTGGAPAIISTPATPERLPPGGGENR